MEKQQTHNTRHWFHLKKHLFDLPPKSVIFFNFKNMLQEENENLISG